MNLRLPFRSLAAWAALALVALSLGCLYPDPGYGYEHRHGYGRWYGPDYHYHGH